jgi:hypothetical protein
MDLDQRLLPAAVFCRDAGTVGELTVTSVAYTAPPADADTLRMAG